MRLSQAVPYISIGLCRYWTIGLEEESFRFIVVGGSAVDYKLFIYFYICFHMEKSILLDPILRYSLIMKKNKIH